MINLIDFDLLRRIVNCIYDSTDNFGTILTQNEQGLQKITVRDDFENGQGNQRFSINRNLSIESHDGTDIEKIIECFRNNGIHAR